MAWRLIRFMYIELLKVNLSIVKFLSDYHFKSYNFFVRARGQSRKPRKKQSKIETVFVYCKRCPRGSLVTRRACHRCFFFFLNMEIVVSTNKRCNNCRVVKTRIPISKPVDAFTVRAPRRKRSSPCRAVDCAYKSYYIDANSYYGPLRCCVYI